VRTNHYCSNRYRFLHVAVRFKLGVFQSRDHVIDSSYGTSIRTLWNPQSTRRRAKPMTERVVQFPGSWSIPHGLRNPSFCFFDGRAKDRQPCFSHSFAGGERTTSPIVAASPPPISLERLRTKVIWLQKHRIKFTTVLNLIAVDSS